MSINLGVSNLCACCEGGGWRSHGLGSFVATERLSLASIYTVASGSGVLHNFRLLLQSGISLIFYGHRSGSGGSWGFARISDD